MRRPLSATVAPARNSGATTHEATQQTGGCASAAGPSELPVPQLTAVGFSTSAAPSPDTALTSAPPASLRGCATETSASANRTGEALADAKPSCVHHWLIETPAGATSKGRCKRCKATREFSNVGEPVWREWRDGKAPSTAGGWDRSIN